MHLNRRAPAYNAAAQFWTSMGQISSSSNDVVRRYWRKGEAEATHRCSALGQSKAPVLRFIWSVRGRLTVKLAQGASEVAPGCVVGGGSCAHRHHCAAKALPLRRRPCPVRSMSLLFSQMPVFHHGAHHLAPGTNDLVDTLLSDSWQRKAVVCIPASVEAHNDEGHGGEDIDHSLSCAPVIVPRTLRNSGTNGESMPRGRDSGAQAPQAEGSANAP